MTRLPRNLRFALRRLGRRPSFVATTVGILGLGIGTATAMSAVLQRVVVARLPVRDQDALVLPHALIGGHEYRLRPQELEQLRRSMRTLRDVAGVSWAESAAQEEPAIVGDRTILTRDAGVTGNFFDVLGSRPAVGRLIRPQDADAGAVTAVVLNYQVWVREFGADPSVVGKHLGSPFDATDAVIVGVAPPGLDYPVGADLWYSIPEGANAGLRLVGRLAPGSTVALARAEFFETSKGIAYESRKNAAPFSAGAVVDSFADEVVGPTRPVLAALALAIGFLFVVACLNVGNLLLWRGVTRRHELAIKRALGASVGDLAASLLSESSLIALAGGALGLMVGRALLAALVAHPPPQFPRVANVSLGGAPIASASVATLIAVILCGAAPAVGVLTADLAGALRSDARMAGAAHTGRGLRHLLVGFQVALAAVALAGAGLLLHTVDRLQRLPLGFEPDHVTTFHVWFPVARYGQPRNLRALDDLLLRRLQAVPGVAAVTPIEMPPFLGRDLGLTRLTTAGGDFADTAKAPLVADEFGGPDLFRVLGIRMLRGRGFLPSDVAGAAPVVVVSHALAEELWPGENPIGKLVRQIPNPDSVVFRTVVGEVDDTRYRSLRSATATAYFPWRQYFKAASSVFAVRTRIDPVAILPALQRAVRDVDSRLGIWAARPVSESVNSQLALPRLTAFLLSAFSLVAMLLCATGVYGAVSFGVRQRTRELGLRMALGASATRVRSDILREGLVVVAIGGAVGIVVALAGSRFLEALLFQVSPFDPMAFGGALVVLVAAGLIATYGPARRATKIDPAIALRAE